MPGEAAPLRGFTGLYVLAYAGAFVAFMPFVSLLLQVKVAAIDPAGRVALMGQAVVGGALVAGIANIGWGWVSDRFYARSGTRRPAIAAGVAATVAAFGALHAAHDPATLLLAVAGFQIGLNLVLAPLVAVMADEVPEARRGRIAGLLGIAHPVGVLAVAAVTMFDGEGARYAVNAALLAAMLVPFVLLARERGGGGHAVGVVDGARYGPRDLALAWGARLAIQVAGNGLTAYAYFHFVALRTGPGDPSGPVARAMAAAMLAAAGATVLAGRASDAFGGRRPYLATATLLVAGGLAGMTAAPGFWAAIAAYGAAMTGLSVFLALHAALAMRLLPSPASRARDLGILNLTNSLPACVPPIIAAVMGARPAALPAIFAALALVALVGGAGALCIRPER